MKRLILLFLICLVSLVSLSLQTSNNSVFRVFPYLQLYGEGRVQLSWITGENVNSSIELYNSSNGQLIYSETITPELMTEVYYTPKELNQDIPGLTQGSWLQQAEAYKHIQGENRKVFIGRLIKE